ncbi:MAG TPA: sigma-70 family RNA polymerase sigma factor [Gemmatimonadaceae bacterium]|jgi:RNA polymerase sigma factor (sigma-70 family)|nr:sigma-70 family RNA polymerase sigma factor [Gemmatimonadaceae bacterium]
MAPRQQLEALCLANLTAIQRIAGAVCRRHGLSGDEAEDFGSWVSLRMVENDYAILGKFRGESSLTTYLTVVIAMLFRDYRVQRWGRWRPSAAAVRRGRVAVQLETLVYRDGHRFDQAAEVLRTRGETAMSDRDLASMFAELPTRGPLRPREVGAEPLAGLPASGEADDPLRTEGDASDRAIIDRALGEALRELPAEDRVVVRLRYWEGMTVADIARALHVPQKPVYRQIDRALAELRRRVERSGVSREQARALLTALVE